MAPSSLLRPAVPSHAPRGLWASVWPALHAAGTPLRFYRAASTRFPLATAFATCFMKGAASDAISQLTVERAPRLDLTRNLSFALFSGAYLGIGQHLVYNVAFTRVFGASRDALTAGLKVVADATVHVPMLYLPLYYMFETVALGRGSAADGLRRYGEDAPRVLRTYWTMWPAVHFTSFTLLPPEMRIGFVACVSFVWLVYLSYASHAQPPDAH